MDVTFAVLLDLPAETPITFEKIDLRDWGRTLVFGGTAGGDTARSVAFELRLDDCRDLHWRVYVHDAAARTALVGFAPGRNQHRSPLQMLTEHFGLTLYYGSLSISRT